MQQYGGFGRQFNPNAAEFSPTTFTSQSMNWNHSRPAVATTGDIEHATFPPASVQGVNFAHSPARVNTLATNMNFDRSPVYGHRQSGLQGYGTAAGPYPGVPPQPPQLQQPQQHQQILDHQMDYKDYAANSPYWMHQRPPPLPTANAYHNPINYAGHLQLEDSPNPVHRSMNLAAAGGTNRDSDRAQPTTLEIYRRLGGRSNSPSAAELFEMMEMIRALNLAGKITDGEKANFLPHLMKRWDKLQREQHHEDQHRQENVPSQWQSGTSVGASHPLDNRNNRVDGPAPPAHNSELEMPPSQCLDGSRDSPNIEIEDIFKPVIVHFSGACKEDSSKPKDFTIDCKNGKVMANKEILMSSSAFFFRRIKYFFSFLPLHFCDAHEVSQIVELITHGRVVVLKKRLSAFMKSLRTFEILGVFASEDAIPDPDGTATEKDTEVFSTEVLSMQTNDPCIPVPQKDGQPKQVRCGSCGITFMQDMFNMHYSEYHEIIEDGIRCCGYIFFTKYDHVNHKKRDCKSDLRSAPQNVSAIYPNLDNSGIAVNLNVKRPDINTHSTPI